MHHRFELVRPTPARKTVPAAALAAALLVGCSVDGTVGDEGPGASVATASEAPVALSDPATADAAPISPFGPVDTAPDEGERLGADGDTVGSAGDPSALPGADVGATPTLPEEVAGDAATLPGTDAGAASALPSPDAAVPGTPPQADPSTLPAAAPATDGAEPEVAFADDAFTGFWSPTDPVPIAPRKVLRVVALPGPDFEILSFLDRASEAGDAPGNCFEAAGGGVHTRVGDALRPIAQANAVRDYEAYTHEDGFLVLTRHVAPGGPGTTVATYTRALPGLAAEDLPVCGADGG